MRKITSFILGALALGFVWSSPAQAQSGCQYIAAGAVLTPGQWNDCFSIKQDYPAPITIQPGTLTNQLNTQTSNYTIESSDCGYTIQAGTGATGFFTVTIPSVTGFPATCSVEIVNGDSTRGKGISGITIHTQVLWPLQAMQVSIVNGAWTLTKDPGRWEVPGGTTNLYTDFTNGTDTLGATDGLASGSSAFKTVEKALEELEDQFDWGAVTQSVVVVNMAANTVDAQGIHYAPHDLSGASGGAALQIVGASLAVTGAVSNAGACEITVSSTSTYSANQVVSVYGVSGATGCNGTWQVTKTDSTHLTLQSTTFGGSYTSGGTVTNGSVFNPSGSDGAACYFGTVIQFQNVYFQGSQNALHPQWGCKIYLNAGNIFGGTSIAGDSIYIDSYGQVRLEADIGIAHGTPVSFLEISNAGLFLADFAVNINILPGLNPTYSEPFVWTLNQGLANFSGITINTNSNTVTAQRCESDSEGLLISATGNANTYFPGTSNCTLTNGGVIDNSVALGTGFLAGIAYASLPGPVTGQVAYISDGKSSNCGDSACTTWGTTITGGGGSLKLMAWFNGSYWTLIGK
jgi:hypothetical protein